MNPHARMVSGLSDAAPPVRRAGRRRPCREGRDGARRTAALRVSEARVRTRRGPRRRRLAGLLRLAVFLVLVFLAVWAGVRVAQAASDAGDYGGERYVVQVGDTLWDIALRHCDDVDPRRVVWDIRVANGLTGKYVLRPGDTVLLPCDGESRRR